MVRPLRLTTDEAVALTVALRTLREIPGLAEGEAVSRALAKVSAAAGHAAEQAAPVAVSVDAREQALAVVRGALERHRALHLHYYVPSRDERTERTVDPMRLLLVDGHWYLEAWCRRAEGVRLFRLDRVDEVVVLDEPAAPPPQAHERDVDAGLYQPGDEAPLVRLRLARTARWVADYYPVEDVARSRTRPAGWRCRCGPRTWPGPAGWSPRWAGRPSSTSRWSWGSRSPRRRGRLSPATRTDPGGLQRPASRGTARARGRRLGSGPCCSGCGSWSPSWPCWCSASSATACSGRSSG